MFSLLFFNMTMSLRSIMCKTKTLWFNSNYIWIKNILMKRMLKKFWLLNISLLSDLLNCFVVKISGGQNLEQNLNCIRLVPHFFSINFAYKIFNSIYKARHSCKKMCAFFGVDKTKMDLSKVYRPTWMMKINFCSKGYNYCLDYNKQTKLSRTYD